MKTAIVVLIGYLSSFSAPALASAITFDFSGNSLFGSRTIQGSGVFTTSDISTQVGGQTAFAITGITGQVNGSQIAAPGNSFYGNYFTTGPAFLDGSGLRFFTASGLDVRFFFQDPPTSRYRVNTFGTGGGFSGFVTATSAPAVAAVPGPIVGAGLPGLVMAAGALLTWRRRKRNQLAA